MPFQNRVFPDGSLRAVNERGLYLGNRGGRFHNLDQTLKKRHYTNKLWIFCLLHFKNRARKVFGEKGYTELFFCDEVSALASGHRPCFECQREKALEFAHYFALGQGLSKPLKAPQMDDILHSERLKPYALPTTPLPDGVMGKCEERFLALHQGQWLEWSFSGYSKSRLLPSHLLTPISLVKTLSAGYKPVWQIIRAV